MKIEFKFKKGDKVKLIDAPLSVKRTKVGHEYEIREVSFDPDLGLHYGIYNPSQCVQNMSWYVAENHLELI